MPGGLARSLNAAGGITMAEACARADAELKTVSQRCIGVVRECIEGVARLAEQGPPAEPVRREMHKLSCSVTALGGMFGRDALSRAAYCFCRLLDETAPGWNAEAVGVHVRALRLLASPDCPPEEAQAGLLAGLNKVRRHAAAGA